MKAEWQLAVDIGGTFTDLLLVDRVGGAFQIEKLLTTHADPAAGVLEGLERIAGLADTRRPELDSIVHATTLVTNAVIERRGARTALLVTEGFRDMLIIGREHRYDMYDVLLEKPEPLISRQDTFAVPERVLVDGSVLRPLDEEAVLRIAEEIQRRGIEAVAVCLLHSYQHPQHERRVRDLLLEVIPDLPVTISHEVIGELREYERASTAVANAYVQRLVDRYLDQLEQGLAKADAHGNLLVMLSNGGVATPDTARRFPVRLIESGPAAGALAAAAAGARMGQPDLLSFDMGGTTAKACIITDGRPTLVSEFETARLSRFKKGSGLPLQISSIELIEIGAGGGSIARIDHFGLLQVGPESMGSDPGPACYGRGGQAPTVTDADLLLGYLNPDFFLGGRMSLDVDAARAAIGRDLAAPLGVTETEAAWIIHEVVNENMANAARIHAVERGADLRLLPLFAFGGAGPVHADRVARNLGIDVVIAPLGAGVGSTLGLLSAPLTFDFVRTSVAPVAALDWPAISAVLRELENEGRALLSRAGVRPEMIAVEHAADLRLVGQAHEITAELPGARPGPGDEHRLVAAFESTYRGLFGRQPPGVPVELVSWRVRVRGPKPTIPSMAFATDVASPSVGGAIKNQREAYFPESGGFRLVDVIDRYKLPRGAAVQGPAIIEERESTFVIGPDATAGVDDFYNLLVTVPV